MNNIKVGFDISQLAHPGGVAMYTKNLALGLEKIGDIELVPIYMSLRKPYKGDIKNVKSFPIPPTIGETLFNKLRVIGIDALIGSTDVFHSSDWIQPRTRAKKVTTYHDVVPLKYPQWSHPKVVAVHKRRLSLVEREIDMVIAVSENTKRDLLEISKIPAEKITVVYEGVGEEFKPQDPQKVEEFKKRFNLPDDFILAISGVGERRNLDRVKEASTGYNLVIAGQTITYLPSQEMSLLYNAAKVLLYPSFYEGFGLPILEAMACGTPVITSNVSSMPEVGGDAAMYVNPWDIKDIKNKLRLVIEDDKLRSEMVKKGFKQTEKFSWEKCAKETADLYRKVTGNENLD